MTRGCFNPAGIFSAASRITVLLGPPGGTSLPSLRRATASAATAPRRSPSGYIAQIGLTSIAPWAALGQRAAHSSAASRSGASIRK